MSKKIEDRQRFIRYYKEQTGTTDIDMHKVALFALQKGWKMPTPRNPVDILAEQFAGAARVEYRTDTVTKRRYRAQQALPVPSVNGVQKHLWIDVDDPSTTRQKMLKVIMKLREGMVDDGVAALNVVEHWNRTRPSEEPIQLPLDLTDDITWRMNEKERKAS